MQEVLLARKIIILCGNAQVDWDHIVRLERQVLQRQLHSILKEPVLTSAQIFEALNRIANFSTCKAKRQPVRTAAYPRQYCCTSYAARA